MTPFDITRAVVAVVLVLAVSMCSLAVYRIHDALAYETLV